MQGRRVQTAMTVTAGAVFIASACCLGYSIADARLRAAKADDAFAEVDSQLDALKSNPDASFDDLAESQRRILSAVDDVTDRSAEWVANVAIAGMFLSLPVLIMAAVDRVRRARNSLR